MRNYSFADFHAHTSVGMGVFYVVILVDTPEVRLCKLQGEKSHTLPTGVTGNLFFYFASDASLI